MRTAKICRHLREQPQLSIEYVLDTHLHVTDAFAKCAHCDARYLIELADLLGKISVFRISALEAEAVTTTIASLNKGSCDISRARNEVFSLSAGVEELDLLLVMQSGVFTDVVPRPADMTLPKRSWRELACDGALVESLGLED